MSTYAGIPGQVNLEDQLTNRYSIPSYPDIDSQWIPAGRLFYEMSLFLGQYIKGANASRAARVFHALSGADQTVPQDDFFGHMYVLPLRIEAGFILSTLNFTLDLYNSYKVPRTFQSFTNNAGPGVTITDLPSLPTVVEDQDGFTMNLQISADGPAINGTLVFTFDTETVTVYVTGVRTAIFPFQPEDPLTERLVFVTDVMEHRDGTEQRVAVRGEAPRQEVDMIIEHEGRARQYLETLVFSNQGLSFGLPVWWEQTRLTSPITATDTLANVQETAYRDFRVGSNFIVWTGPFDWEVLQVDTVGSSSITASSQFQGDYTAGALVMPVRVGFMKENLSGLKRPVNLQQNRVAFAIADNDLDLADASVFASYNGEVLLDEENMIDNGGLSEQWSRPLVVVDSEAGDFTVFPNRGRSKKSSSKGFYVHSMQRMWEVRQLFHFLRGRFKSFYIPTFYEDLTPVSGISSGGVTLNVENVGYSLLVQDRSPRNVVQVLKTDGTYTVRQIVSSSEIDEDEEQITVDSSWGISASVSEIERVSFVERSRLDTDTIELIHHSYPGRADVEVPLVTVFE